MPDKIDDSATPMENELTTEQSTVAGNPTEERIARYSDNHFRLFHANRNDRNIKDDYEKYAGIKPVRNNICLLAHHRMIK